LFGREAKEIEMKVASFATGAALVFMVRAAHAAVIWDNGASNQVIFNGATTYLGYSSGNTTAATPQRWAAQAFTMPTGFTSINQLDASWFESVGSEPATVNYGIFQRTGASTPGALVATGVLGAYSVGTDDPRIPVTDTWFHSYTGLNIPLSAGDYYLTIYGDGLGTANTSGFGFINWLTGAPGVDSQVTYNDWMWRSSAYPAPGFQVYNPAAVQPTPTMTDVTDRWNTSYVIYAVPGPGSLALLGLAALGAGRRRR
jgi:hypothetical protein